MAIYKRAVLIFQDIERLIKIAKGKCQFIFAGKAHPKDQMGKDYIKQITETSEKLEKEGVKVVFVENYNMDIALLLTAGVDIWLNTPDRYREASGTSGMKAVLNGVPNLSVLDGWWLEGWRKARGKPGGGECMAGWAIGPDDSDPKAMENNWDIDSNYIYDLLENYVIPKYWNHDEWIFMQKNAIALGAFFNTHRMVREYAKKAYLLQQQPLWKYTG